MAKIVFEIGGTHMRIARVEGEKPGSAKKIPTPREPQRAVEELVVLAQEVVEGEVITHAAGGIPGVISHEGRVFRSPNLSGWNGFEFGSALKSALGAEAVAVYNDADIGALGEARFGAGKGFDIVGFLVNGTGVGGSRVVEGTIDKFAYGFEPGQYRCDSSGATLEGLVSGRAIEKKYGTSAAEVGKKAWEELTPALARGLYTAMLFWSPHVVVLGGSVFLNENAFQLEALERELRTLNTMFPELPVLRRGTLGDSAGLWGAATLLT